VTGLDQVYIVPALAMENHGARTSLTRVGELMREYSFGFALLLTLTLLVLNLIESRNFGWSEQLATFAPLAIAAMASTPAVISGGGGIDLTVSPLMFLTSGVFVSWLVPHDLGGAPAVPILLGVGAAVGALNGLLIILLRVPPVVVTLSMYFVLVGVDLKVTPDPASFSSSWVQQLAGSVGPIPGALFTIGIPLVIWASLGVLPYRRALYAVGSSDATAFASGVNVALVRVAAYSLGGVLASIGGLALVGLVSSANASLASSYTLVAIAAVALGGTSFWGGRGGLIGSLFGAASIYLLQNVLTILQVDPSWLQVMYGATLVLAVVLGGIASGKENPG
jgi:ribose transport system permease protein